MSGAAWLNLIHGKQHYSWLSEKFARIGYRAGKQLMARYRPGVRIDGLKHTLILAYNVALHS